MPLPARLDHEDNPRFPDGQTADPVMMDIENVCPVLGQKPCAGMQTTGDIFQDDFEDAYPSARNKALVDNPVYHRKIDITSAYHKGHASAAEASRIL